MTDIQGTKIIPINEISERNDDNGKKREFDERDINNCLHW